ERLLELLHGSVERGSQEVKGQNPPRPSEGRPHPHAVLPVLVEFQGAGIGVASSILRDLMAHGNLVRTVLGGSRGGREPRTKRLAECEAQGNRKRAALFSQLRGSFTTRYRLTGRRKPLHHLIVDSQFPLTAQLLPQRLLEGIEGHLLLGKRQLALDVRLLLGQILRIRLLALRYLVHEPVRRLVQRRKRLADGEVEGGREPVHGQQAGQRIILCQEIARLDLKTERLGRR